MDEVDVEKENRIAREARQFGAEYTPRPRPDRTVFTTFEAPEYVVLAKDNRAVPASVFEALDSLHRYYLANEKELAIEHQRRDALAEAHRKYREENPPEPEDIVINFWRESGTSE